MQSPFEYQALRVLIAEDVPVNQRLITAILGSLGVTAKVVDDGQAAVAASEQEAFDLVLMDICMPVMDGLSAIRAIRRREKQARKPRALIYVVSSHHEARDLLASRAAGADGHLRKPIEVALVLHAVNEALKRRRSRRRAEAVGSRLFPRLLALG